MLKLDAWNLIFTVINLLVLFIGLKLVLFKPVQKIIAQRQEEADIQLNEAKAKQAKADELTTECEVRIANIEEERKQTLSEARKSANEQYKKIVEEAQNQAVRIKTDAKSEAEKTKNQIMVDAKKEIADMVVSAAAKVTAKHSGADEDASLYDEFLDKAGE